MRQVPSWAIVVALSAILACKSSPTSSVGGGETADGGSRNNGAPGDGGGPDDGATGDAASPTIDAGPAPLAGVRFANWSPDAPSVDFCLAPHGTTDFRGPMIGAALQALEDAGGLGDASVAGGLSFPQVGSYFYLPVGSYDARLVAAGSPDCAVGVIVPDDAQLAGLDAGTMTTIAAMGRVAPSSGEARIGISSFRDDFDATLEGGAPTVLVRFIHAAPSLPPVVVGTGLRSAGTFFQWFVNVPFGQAGNLQEAETVELGGPPPPPVVDGHGYLVVGGLSSATVSVHAFLSDSNLVVAPNVTAIPGTVVTLVLVGDPALQLVQCFDNAGSLGVLASCSIVSQ
jgi:hypothetical protein